MSGWTAIWLGALCLTSCFCCYRLGQLNVLHHFREHDRLRREREQRWREFKDEDFD